ncbi:hypothetical protein [Methylomagnum ishizawai]|uniref:hypothetical protein n=1 Tax=Methylomagnum ishizawai TaxID=1760988 RepID=UPI001C7E3F2C|nr:hypothetical protein [Methylomagnum ishizawai]
MKVLVLFAPMFTQPVWGHVQELVAGAVLCRGPRTVAAALRTLGLAAERQTDQGQGPLPGCGALDAGQGGQVPGVDSESRGLQV